MIQYYCDINFIEEESEVQSLNHLSKNLLASVPHAGFEPSTVWFCCYVVWPACFGLFGTMFISNELCISLRITQLALARSFHIPNNFHAQSMYLLR